MANRHKIIRILVMMLSAATTGCRDDSDARVEQVMQESLERQAEQNRQIVEQSKLSAESVQRVVEAESAARTEVVELQRDLVQRDNGGREQLVELTQNTQSNMTAERAVLDKQRGNLEQERQRLALERNRDPMVAQTIAVVGTLVACTIPLVLAGYVLYSANRGNDDEVVVNEILVSEITANCPTFLASESPRLSSRRSESSPLPPESD